MKFPTKIRTVLSDGNGWRFELLHDRTDPCIWIIRRSRALLWFRWKSSAFWFYDKNNALNFARIQAASLHPAAERSIA